MWKIRLTFTNHADNFSEDDFIFTTIASRLNLLDLIKSLWRRRNIVVTDWEVLPETFSKTLFLLSLHSTICTTNTAILRLSNFSHSKLQFYLFNTPSTIFRNFVYKFSRICTWRLTRHNAMLHFRCCFPTHFSSKIIKIEIQLSVIVLGGWGCPSRLEFMYFWTNYVINEYWFFCSKHK